MKKVAKAVTAGIAAAAAAFVAAVTDGSVSQAELGTIIGAAIVAFGAVWRVPNAQ